MAQRQEELEHTQALLVAENESLKAQNKTLKYQLSFFQNLFSSSPSHIVQLSAPNSEGGLPMFEAWDDPGSQGGLEIPPSATKKSKALACQAVVLLVVLSIGTEDLSPCALTPTPQGSLHHHTGRTLLSLGDVTANAGHAQHCGKPNLTGMLQSLPLSTATTSSFLAALRLGAVVWFARRAMQALMPNHQHDIRQMSVLPHPSSHPNHKGKGQRV